MSSGFSSQDTEVPLHKDDKFTVVKRRKRNDPISPSAAQPSSCNAKTNYACLKTYENGKFLVIRHSNPSSIFIDIYNFLSFIVFIYYYINYVSTYMFVFHSMFQDHCIVYLKSVHRLLRCFGPCYSCQQLTH